MDKVKEILDTLQKLLLPPKAFSWQTLILLSIFSCLMAALAGDLIRSLLATCGWIFLIFGVGWFTTENPIMVGGLSLGPWITGILVSIFLFGEWLDERPSLLFVSWPLISAAIASLGEFIQSGPRFKYPTQAGRQRLVILFLTNLIISCWFQLYFVIQGWLEIYPSLLANDFNQSNFVVRLGVQTTQAPTGVIILNQAEATLKAELEPRSWPEVERWLLTLKQQPTEFENAVMQQLPPSEENALWQLQAQILPDQPDYTLQMLALWQGPSSDLASHYLTKTCRVTQGENPPASASPAPEAAVSAPLASPDATSDSSPLARSNGQVFAGPVTPAIPTPTVPTPTVPTPAAPEALPQTTSTSKIECGSISRPTLVQPGPTLQS
ncbi:MAG: DUF5357 domain-containing protein [Trichocoleus desertorum ATA4-8-CV12]|jgi:hypothetical protein|nr:DUF5357 domain-containing protein [Trichocoleus desertorum ATA4-8-CV12]